MKIILFIFICLNIQISYGQTNGLAHLATNNKNQTISINLVNDSLVINTLRYKFYKDLQASNLTKLIGSIYFKKEWLRIVILIEPQELKVYRNGKITETFEF